MARRPRPGWDRREHCYRTDAGGKPKYFRGIARDDHVGLAAAFAEHLATLDAETRKAEPAAGDIVVAFLLANRGVKKRTVRSHKERLAAWGAWTPSDGGPSLSERPASSLTAKDLKTPLRQWEARGWSDNYRAGICRSVKAAFAWAASEDGGRLIPSNPFTEVKGPSVSQSPERYAETREIAAYLRFAWRRAQARPGIYRHFARNLVLLLRVATNAGCRPGELCSAWWADLDRERGAIVIPPDRHKTGGKVKKERVVFLSPRLITALERERSKPESHPVSMFIHKKGRGSAERGAEEEHGEPWGRFLKLPDGRPSFESDSTALSKPIRKLRALAIKEGELRKRNGERTWNLDLIKDEGDNRFVAYRLRHTYISDGLMSGVRGASIAEVAGTSERMIQQVYGHLLEDHLQETAGAIRAGRKRDKPK